MQSLACRIHKHMRWTKKHNHGIKGHPRTLVLSPIDSSRRQCVHVMQEGCVLKEFASSQTASLLSLTAAQHSSSDNPPFLFRREEAEENKRRIVKWGRRHHPRDGTADVRRTPRRRSPLQRRAMLRMTR